MSRAGALRGTCLGVAVAGAAATLVACGSEAPAELVDVRWQLTRIEDAPAEESGTAVESGLSQTDQTRSWIALGGGESFTGGIGCMALSGTSAFIIAAFVSSCVFRNSSRAARYASVFCLPF